MEGVIYSKKYPKESAEEKYKELLETAEGEPEKPDLTCEEIIAKIFKDVTYKELPGREEKSQRFIQQAIKISEEYELDIEIQKLDTSIIIYISFDGPRILARELKLLIAVADNVETFSDVFDRDITLVLQYYTKAVYRRGRCINYIDEEPEKSIEAVLQSFPPQGKKQ